MVPPTGDGGSPAPIDRPILEFLRARLRATEQVARATVNDSDGHLALECVFEPAYYPESVETATLTIRWYTNDDFAIHYRETGPDGAWECRWDRHPNPHDAREHFHPPPTAAVPGRDASWPSDYRDVIGVVLDAIEDRIGTLWEG